MTNTKQYFISMDWNQKPNVLWKMPSASAVVAEKFFAKLFEISYLQSFKKRMINSNLVEIEIHLNADEFISIQESVLEVMSKHEDQDIEEGD